MWLPRGKPPVLQKARPTGDGDITKEVASGVLLSGLVLAQTEWCSSSLLTTTMSHD